MFKLYKRITCVKTETDFKNNKPPLTEYYILKVKKENLVGEDPCATEKFLSRKELTPTKQDYSRLRKCGLRLASKLPTMANWTHF